MKGQTNTVKLAEKELEELKKVLDENELLSEDLTLDHLNNFLLLRRNGKLIGAVGLEIIDKNALLRSLVVVEEWRGNRIGAKLIDGIEKLAEDRGVKRLYLLTETADKFFAKKDYMPVNRRDVPESIRNTKEFSTYCPSTAKCMMKYLVE